MVKMVKWGTGSVSASVAKQLTAAGVKPGESKPSNNTSTQSNSSSGYSRLGGQQSKGYNTLNQGQSTQSNKTPTATTNMTEQSVKAQTIPAEQVVLETEKLGIIDMIKAFDAKIPGGVFGQRDVNVTDPNTGQPLTVVANAVPFGLGGVETAATTALNLNTIRQGGTAQFVMNGGLGAAKNAVTAAKSTSMVMKILAQFKKPSVIAGTIIGMLGTYPWGEWAYGEAKEGMIFNMNKALATGNPEVIAEFQKTSDEIFDTNVWEGIARLLPTNLIHGFYQKYKALQAQKLVNDHILQDTITQIETGETDDDKWERIRQEEADADKKAVDYYNSERKLQVTWEREATVAARNEDAAFWAAEQAKSAIKEAEDRQAIADFWIAYRKTVAKLADENRPSNLNFGLI